MSKGVSNSIAPMSAPPAGGTGTLTTLFVVLVPSVGLNLLAIAIGPQPSLLTWVVNWIFVAIVALGLWAHRRGRARDAAGILSLGFFVVATIGVLFLGGTKSIALFVYVPVVATATLLWSRKAGGALTVASALVVLIVAQLDALAVLPESAPATWPRMWVVFTGCLLVTTVVVGLSIKDSSQFSLELERARRRLSRVVEEASLERRETERRHDEVERDYQKRLRDAERTDAMGRLAGSVAHDFNNLLAAIANSSALLEHRATDEHTRRLVAEINDATQRSAAMVKKLLAIGRRQQVHPEEIDFGKLVRDMRPLLENLCGPRIDIALVDEAQHSLVLADRVQLEQVVLNLVVNARDAMPNGGPVGIRLSTIEPPPGAAHADRWVQLSVADQGTGIAKEALDRVWEPFFTTKGLGGGTGLGLSTVHSAVLDSKGHVEVASAEGVGTRFDVMLPCLAWNEEDAPRASQTNMTRLRSA